MKKALIVVFVGLAMMASVSSFAKGDAAKGKTLAASCGACHGADGNSSNPDWPKLAGQGEGYLVKQLMDFRSGARKNAVMGAQAAMIASDEDVEHIAAYFASQQSTAGAGDKDKVEEGRLIYKGGKVSAKITACAACHGPTGTGNDAAKFPRIAGQHTAYLLSQLKAFRSGERANDAGKMMQNIASKMSDKDMAAIVEYVAGLKE